MTPAEKIARAAECKHKKFRYRNRGTEAVCLNCGSVQRVQGTGMNIEVVEGWKLDAGEVQEHEPTCSCSVCHLKRQGEKMSKESEYGGHADNERSVVRARARAKQPPSGVQLIAEERQRQINEEGWTDEHDDNVEDRGGLVRAAMCYADSSLENHRTYLEPSTWPWDEEWDKRDKHNRLRKLAIAGALIAAEIDRVQREAAKK